MKKSSTKPNLFSHISIPSKNHVTYAANPSHFQEQKSTFSPCGGQIQRIVIVMFDSSASDNDDAPDSPISLSMECDTIMNDNQSSFNYKLKHKSSEVRDELTLSASDNDDVPELPILLSMECDTIMEW